MIVRELVTLLGFEVDDKKLKEFDKEVTKVKSNLKLLVGAATAGAAGLTAITLATANSADKFAKQAANIGFSTERLQELTLAGEFFGVAQQDMNSSLSAFNRRVGAAAEGNQAYAQAFRQLGIDIIDSNGALKSNDQLLRESISRLSDIDDTATRANIADKLFSESGRKLVGLFEAGLIGIDEAVQKVRDTGAIISNEDAKKAEEFKDLLGEVKLFITGARNALGTGLIPEVSRFVKQGLEWARANREIIQQNLEGAVRGIILALRILWSVLSTGFSILSRFVDAVGGAENAVRLLFIALGIMTGASIIRAIFVLVTSIKTVGTAALVAQLKLLLIPIAIAAIIAGIALLIEDIFRWVNGQESAIERVLGDWDTFKAVMRLIGQDIRDAFREFGSDIAEFFSVDNLKTFGLFLVDGILTPLKQASKLANFLIEKLTGSRIQLLTDVASPTLASDIAGAASRSTRAANGSAPLTVMVDSKPNVIVPAGTPEQQAQAIREQVKQVSGAEMQAAIRAAVNQLPVVE